VAIDCQTERFIAVASVETTCFSNTVTFCKYAAGKSIAWTLSTKVPTHFKMFPRGIELRHGAM